MEISMKVMDKAIFGPVVCAIPSKEIEEVIPAANKNPYGLAAAVWTRDIAKAHRGPLPSMVEGDAFQPCSHLRFHR